MKVKDKRDLKEMFPHVEYLYSKGLSFEEIEKKLDEYIWVTDGDIDRGNPASKRKIKKDFDSAKQRILDGDSWTLEEEQHLEKIKAYGECIKDCMDHLVQVSYLLNNYEHDYRSDIWDAIVAGNTELGNKVLQRSYNAITAFLAYPDHETEQAISILRNKNYVPLNEDWENEVNEILTSKHKSTFSNDFDAEDYVNWQLEKESDEKELNELKEEINVLKDTVNKLKNDRGGIND